MRPFWKATLPLSMGLAAAGSGVLVGQGEPGPLVRRYAGTLVYDRMLAEPPIASELGSLLGSARAHLDRNLFVAGSVDLIGDHLAISGNASHGGGEEEAIVCIGERPPAVHAAILSQGSIRIYSRVVSYRSLPRCITDWITQVNSAHRDRFEQPANVELKRPSP